MCEEIAEHLEDFWRQPGALARPLQGIELRVQSTIGKAVEHISSAAQRQIATERFGETSPCNYVNSKGYTSFQGMSGFFTANLQACLGQFAGKTQVIRRQSSYHSEQRWHPGSTPERTKTYGAQQVVALSLAVGGCGVLASVQRHGRVGPRWALGTHDSAGIQAFEQGDYAEAVRQFQAALPLADGGSLVPSLMNLAAVYYAQGEYTDAARLYQRALVLQEQVLWPDHPQLVPVLEANAALYRKLHPVQSLLPWSPASHMAARVRRIREREERTLLQDFPWGPPNPHQLFGDGVPGEWGKGLFQRGGTRRLPPP
jgi:tetratricopeptide (TPR) repeat protein